MLKTTLIVITSAVVAGCGVIPKNFGILFGRAWCDVRYLDTISEYQDYQTGEPEFRKKLDLSKAGYIYAVAAVLPLQIGNDETEFHFGTPERLSEVSDLRISKENGFQAMTFLLKDDKGVPTAVVISFAGSNEYRDYFLHNFALFPVQFADARDYTYRVANDIRFSGLRVVATGVSLGAGLAVHVKKTRPTSKFVNEVWAFNPSPRTDAPANLDPDIYLLANKYELLNQFERSHLGASTAHTATDFGLINSSSFYAHYRWVITRQILHYADLAIYLESGKVTMTTEPMTLLQTQPISKRVCDENTRFAIKMQRARLSTDKNAPR